MTALPSIAFLGPHGTYSHQVTQDYFGPAKLFPQDKIQHVFEIVQAGKVDYGVVPIENSTFGRVTETMNSLRETRLAVRDMVTLKIGHALLGKKVDGTRSVKRVYSHEQGLGQCAEYLRKNYPTAATVSTNSTAKAAQFAVDDEEGLAICSKICAEVYGLTVLDTEIQDGGAANITRFIVLSLPTRPLSPDYPIPTPIPTSLL